LYKVGDKVVYPHHGAGTVVKKDSREVAADVQARYFGAELNDQSLIPGDNPRIAPTRFEDWLRRSRPQK